MTYGNKFLVVCCFVMGACLLFTRDIKAFELQNPTAVFSLGFTSNSNIKNKVDAQEASDSLTDTGLRIVLPGKINKETRVQLEYVLKQDWKRSNETLNSRSSSFNLRFMHVYVKKTLFQFAFLYQDFDVFLASGINFAAQHKLSKTSSAKLDYTTAKRRWPLSVLDGTNSILKLDYRMQLTPKTSISPFYEYEKNSVSLTPGQEYKGQTLGIRYSWKFNDRVTIMPSYDYRTRNYDSATTTCTGCLNNPATRNEKRHQFTLSVGYKLDDAMNLMFKYNYYKNNASSNVPAYAADRDYKAHLFSIMLSIKSTASKSKKQKDEEQ